MRKLPKSSPAESEFLFEIDPEPAPERLTSYGGAAVLIRTLRSVGVPQSVARHIHIKKRDRGYDEATFVESFVGLKSDCGFVQKVQSQAHLLHHADGSYSFPAGCSFEIGLVTRFLSACAELKIGSA